MLVLEVHDIQALSVGDHLVDFDDLEDDLSVADEPHEVDKEK